VCIVSPGTHNIYFTFASTRETLPPPYRRRRSTFHAQPLELCSPQQWYNNRTTKLSTLRFFPSHFLHTVPRRARSITCPFHSADKSVTKFLPHVHPAIISDNRGGQWTASPPHVDLGSSYRLAPLSSVKIQMVYTQSSESVLFLRTVMAGLNTYAPDLCDERLYANESVLSRRATDS
jgi:hypothetical protein